MTHLSLCKVSHGSIQIVAQYIWIVDKVYLFSYADVQYEYISCQTTTVQHCPLTFDSLTTTTKTIYSVASNMLNLTVYFLAIWSTAICFCFFQLMNLSALQLPCPHRIAKCSSEYQRMHRNNPLYSFHVLLFLMTSLSSQCIGGHITYISEKMCLFCCG